MKPLVIGANSVLRMLRDRNNLAFVFVYPLVIVLLFGATFGGGFVPIVGVAVAEEGPLATELVAGLRADPRLSVIEFEDQAGMLRGVERGELEAAVVVPPGYDADLEIGLEVEVGYISRTSGAGPQLQSSLQAVLRRQGGQVAVARFVAERGGVGFSSALTLTRAVAPSVPGIVVAKSTLGQPFYPETFGRYDLGASSQLVLFVFLNALAGSAGLIDSRRLGVSRRMLATPTSVVEVITGEAVGRLAIALFQGLYVVAATSLIFQVNWGDPLGAAALLAVFSLVGAGAALLMGSTLRNEQQATGIAVVAGLALAALGGCMLPLEFYSSTLRTVAHLTPHAWAVDGFDDLVRRGLGLADILPELSVLMGFAATLLGLAAWRLRRALTSP